MLDTLINSARKVILARLPQAEQIACFSTTLLALLHRNFAGCGSPKLWPTLKSMT
jgi:hypothetical protein